MQGLAAGRFHSLFPAIRRPELRLWLLLTLLLLLSLGVGMEVRTKVGSPQKGKKRVAYADRLHQVVRVTVIICWRPDATLIPGLRSGFVIDCLYCTSWGTREEEMYFYSQISRSGDRIGMSACV
jgi:hypothetical protein